MTSGSISIGRRAPLQRLDRVAKHFGHERQQQRAEDHAEDVAHAAEHDHRQHHDRLDEHERLRADESPGSRRRCRRDPAERSAIANASSFMLRVLMPIAARRPRPRGSPPTRADP
jgi:hypothetical protein